MREGGGIGRRTGLKIRRVVTPVGVQVPPFAPNRGVAQLVEYRSPKPMVAGSIPVAPAKNKCFILERYYVNNYLYKKC